MMRSMLLAFAILAVSPPAFAAGVSNELLLSNPWCSSTRDKETGQPRKKRLKFNANGTYASGNRDQARPGGGAGSVAELREPKAGGQWRVDKGELFMSPGGGRKLERVTTALRRSKDGYPIILVDGLEYSQCR